MKFMVMVRATAETEAEDNPGSEELFREMMAYNQALVDAGVMLGGDGLQPSHKGARVRFDGDRCTVIDGPFAETKEQLLGFFIVDCASLDEAIATAKELGKASSSAGSFEVRPLAVFKPHEVQRVDEVRA